MDKIDFSEALGLNPKPHLANCIIAITANGAYLLKSDFDFFQHELFDGDDLESNISFVKSIPTENGIYSCQIEIRTWKCNHPQDPVEWDISFEIKNSALLNI